MGTNNYVSREKYENIKDKGVRWYNMCSELKDKVNKLTQMNKDLIIQNEDLLDQVNDLNNFQKEPNKEMIELENENKALVKDIRNLKKDNNLFSDKLVLLERDLFIKDGKIQRLEDAKKDLNERYLELKEDWRDERRINKKV